MTKFFVSDCFAEDLDQNEMTYAFVGDSPNDGPMFAYFSNSIGVANVREFEGNLKDPPKYITQNIGGVGFAELAELLLQSGQRS